MKQIVSPLLGAVSGGLGMTAFALSQITEAVNWTRLRHIDYAPRPDDIFIVTYPRSGTTWTQMIMYQLTSDGSMDFSHISQVIPWFERLPQSGRSIAALPSPRIFKTHLHYHKQGPLGRDIPKGSCKYIYVARNGKDVAVSYHHFYRSHLGFQGDFDQFFELFMRGQVQFGSWFRHVAGWWAHRNDPNVLFLTYEEMLSALPAALKRIAAFCGFAIAPERFPAIAERCSFAFMKQYEAKFDHITELLWENGMVQNSFLRKGATGEGRDRLAGPQEARFNQEFARWLGASGLNFDAPLVKALNGDNPVVGEHS